MVARNTYSGMVAEFKGSPGSCVENGERTLGGGPTYLPYAQLVLRARRTKRIGLKTALMHFNVGPSSCPFLFPLELGSLSLRRSPRRRCSFVPPHAVISALSLLSPAHSSIWADARGVHQYPSGTLQARAADRIVEPRLLPHTVLK